MKSQVDNNTILITLFFVILTIAYVIFSYKQIKNINKKNLKSKELQWDIVFFGFGMVFFNVIVILMWLNVYNIKI